jgi:hypothetical protein
MTFLDQVNDPYHLLNFSFRGLYYDAVSSVYIDITNSVAFIPQAKYAD